MEYIPLEKPMVSQLVKNCSNFMEPEGFVIFTVACRLLLA